MILYFYMQEKLREVIDSLGGPEKTLVEQQFGTDLQRWVQLFDQITSRSDLLGTFGESVQNDFQSLVGDMDAIITDISRLDVVKNPDALTHVQNRVASFKNSGYQRLLDFKNRMQAIDLDMSSLETFKEATRTARKQAEEFSKSFATSLRKQSRGSTRTLARYYEEKIKELRDNKITSPEEWQTKRIFWLSALAIIGSVLFVVYIALMINWSDFSKYAVQIGVAKLVLLGLAYLQYNFATRNYHISADQIAHYEQQEVIAKTLNDFIATASEDTVLKEHILANATKTLFAEIKTGHLKSRDKDGSMIENIVNQYPKTE